jgi:glycosyltransferase involved in cell wall biosynthesis
VRIVYVSPTASIGGAERVLLDVVASLPPGHDPALVAPGEGPLLERARALGVPVAIAPMPASVASLGDSALRGRSPLAALGLAARAFVAGPRVLAYRSTLSRAIASLRPDVVHTNGLKAHWLARSTAPVVWHLQDFVSERPWAPRLLRRARPRAAIALSNAVAEDARRLFPGLPVETVLGSVDLDVFAPGPGEPARLDTLGELEPRADVVRVGLLGAFGRWKGQDLFLEAAARLPGRPIYFFIVGGPIYATQGSQFSVEELRGKARALGVGAGFVPFQQDPAWVYRSLDVVVHASTRPEPFGRAIAEAMACGRPVVASREGGVPELFQEGSEGVAFTPRDAGALARAIDEVARDPARRGELGKRARERAQRSFARARAGAEVAAVYAKLLGK